MRREGAAAAAARGRGKKKKKSLNKFLERGCWWEQHSFSCYKLKVWLRLRGGSGGRES